MDEIIPNDIRKDLVNACLLHERAVSDPAQCKEFSRLMSGLLSRLEDAKCYKAADRVMSILLDCNPKPGAHCKKSTIIAQVTRRIITNIELQKL